MEVIYSSYISDLNDNTEYDEYTIIETEKGTIETNIEINYTTGEISGEQIINGETFNMTIEQLGFYIEHLQKTDELLRKLPENKIERTNNYER